MDSKSRALNKNPSVLAQPEMGMRDKSIYYEVYGKTKLTVPVRTNPFKATDHGGPESAACANESRDDFKV